MARPQRMIPLSYALVMVAAALLFVSGLAFGLKIQSEQQWCTLLGILESPGTPTTNERAAKIAREIGILADKFHC